MLQISEHFTELLHEVREEEVMILDRHDAKKDVTSAAVLPVESAPTAASACAAPAMASTVISASTEKGMEMGC